MAGGCNLCAEDEGAVVCQRCARLVAALAARGDAAIWAMPPDTTGVTGDPGRRSATELTEHDLETHADLAVAYAEMGLDADAVAMAAVALRASPGSPAHATALGALLSAPLLRDRARLRHRLRSAGDS